MYSLQQLGDSEVRDRIEQDRREGTPTAVWHLAKSAGVDEKDMLYHLGGLGIEVFRWGSDMSRHVSKADTRKLFGLKASE